MKQVSVEKPVRDVDGLLKALRKANPPFDVLSVASDPKRTYVYLQTWEENDPTEIVKAWEDIPELSITIVGNQGSDGVHEALADGADAHTLLVRKVTAEGLEVDGTETLHVELPEGVECIPAKPTLSGGQVMVKVGPSRKAFDFSATIVDPGKRVRPSTVKLRFCAQAPSEEREADVKVISSARNKGFFAALRRFFTGTSE